MAADSRGARQLRGGAGSTFRCHPRSTELAAAFYGLVALPRPAS